MGSASSPPRRLFPLSKSLTKYTSLLSVVVIIVGMILTDYVFSFMSSDGSTLLGPPLLSNIRMSSNYSVMQWPSIVTDHLVSDITRRKVPTLIRNGPAKMWTALANGWNLSDLIPNENANHIILSQCRKHGSALFILENERDRGGMIGQEQSSPVQYEDISLARFQETILNKDVYFYWTGLMSSMSIAKSPPGETEMEVSSSLRHLAHASWKDFHVIEPELVEGLNDQGADFWDPMLWLSQPGVVAQTHFDSQHNFFSTIFGVRRFTFFPPSLEMNPYPSIHRSSRQSQLRLEETADASLFARNNNNYNNINLNDHENNAHDMIFQVDLGPGETLYIPPYWYHRVESLSASLGASVSSPAAVEAALQQAAWHAVPLGAFHTPPQKKSAVRQFLQLLVAQVSGSSLQVVAGSLFRSRFSLLFPPAWIEDTRRRRSFACDVEELGSDSATKFKPTADSIAAIVESTGASLHVKMLFLSDYIEQMSRWAAGPADTALYIHDCLAV